MKWLEDTLKVAGSGRMTKSVRNKEAIRSTGIGMPVRAQKMPIVRCCK